MLFAVLDVIRNVDYFYAEASSIMVIGSCGWLSRLPMDGIKVQNTNESCRSNWTGYKWASFFPSCKFLFFPHSVFNRWKWFLTSWCHSWSKFKSESQYTIPCCRQRFCTFALENGEKLGILKYITTLLPWCADLTFMELWEACPLEMEQSWNAHLICHVLWFSTISSWTECLLGLVTYC